MTRKDFELIAETIKFQRNLFYTLKQREALDDLARTFTYKLAETNPRFDRAEFLKACGVE